MSSGLPGLSPNQLRLQCFEDALNPSSGRGLKLLELGKDQGIGAFLADTRLLDPRFKRGTSARPRISGRHISFGALALAVLAVMFVIFAS